MLIEYNLDFSIGILMREGIFTIFPNMFSIWTIFAACEININGEKLTLFGAGAISVYFIACFAVFAGFCCCLLSFYSLIRWYIFSAAVAAFGINSDSCLAMQLQ